MATKWQKIKVDLDKRYKPKSRQRIADAVVEFITKRTIDEGLDKKNKKFSPYTKKYAKKKGQRRVDLVLTFEMMSSLGLLKEKANELTIGFQKGSQVNAKADGNIRGTYGQSSPIPGKARDFLGIYKKDLNQLIRNLNKEEPLEAYGKRKS